MTAHTIDETNLPALQEAAVGTSGLIERTQDRFGTWPEKLVADAGYGSAENLAWLVHERGIEPHIPVFDKSQRSDGTVSRSDFAYDHARDLYTCPGGKELRQFRRRFDTPRDGVDAEGLMRYRASKLDCDACSLKLRCCPKAPARKLLRSIHEGARDMARDIATTNAYVTSRRERKKVEMLFAHLKRILKLDRLRLRAPCGARDEFLLAATAQNLRKMAKLMTPPAPPQAAHESKRSLTDPPSLGREAIQRRLLQHNRSKADYAASPMQSAQAHSSMASFSQADDLDKLTAAIEASLACHSMQVLEIWI